MDKHSDPGSRAQPTTALREALDTVFAATRQKGWRAFTVFRTLSPTHFSGGARRGHDRFRPKVDFSLRGGFGRFSGFALSFYSP